MKTIKTEGITWIEPVAGAAGDWYYGLDDGQGDLYEAEEIFRAGGKVSGRTCCLIHYPDGQVFVPVPKREGHYGERPVWLDGGIFMIDVDFADGSIRILRFGCEDHHTEVYARIPLASVRDCYNLSLQTAPLTMTRQRVGTNEFEIVWPERIAFPMDGHDSFFLREGDRLFFSRWHEEGDGPAYRYWEETVIRDLSGKVIETFPGDVRRMPNGELWYLG